MPDSFFGLPLHPLVVHATVVLVPLAALLVGLSAVVPRVARWAGPLPWLLAVVGVVLTPLTTSTGEALQRSLGGGSPLVRTHAERGETLIWFVVPLALVAFALWFLRRRGVGKGLLVALAVVAVLVSLATLVDVALIGHSGATAVWKGTGGA